MASVSIQPPSQPSPPPPAVVRYDKPVPGSTLRCLDDPTFDSDIMLPTSAAAAGAVNRTKASDVLEKARDRFDRFWGGNNKEENV